VRGVHGIDRLVRLRVLPSAHSNMAFLEPLTFHLMEWHLGLHLGLLLEKVFLRSVRHAAICLVWPVSLIMWLDNGEYASELCRTCAECAQHAWDVNGGERWLWFVNRATWNPLQRNQPRVEMEGAPIRTWSFHKKIETFARFWGQYVMPPTYTGSRERKKKKGPHPQPPSWEPHIVPRIIIQSYFISWCSWLCLIS
jgi:hypothetical protein